MIHIQHSTELLRNHEVVTFEYRSHATASI